MFRAYNVVSNKILNAYLLGSQVNQISTPGGEGDKYSGVDNCRCVVAK
jgi:hypothetical protein